MVKGISAAHRKYIIKIIKALLPKVKIIAFGSRIRGNAKKYSDLDIALDNKNELDYSALSHLEEIFSASDLPFKVDLVDYRAISGDFRKIVDKTGVKW